MSMAALETLRRMACDELREISEKGQLTGATLDVVHKLTDTIKNIDKICAMNESEEYGQTGEWEMEGRGSYGHGNSYAGRGSRNKEHISNYSKRENSARKSMLEQLNTLIESATSEQDRITLRQCVEQIENA